MVVQLLKGLIKVSKLKFLLNQVRQPFSTTTEGLTLIQG